jgi:broad specificity phosphatase PhoE
MWVLEPSASGAVARLARQMQTLGGDGVVVSPEPKALETGKMIAGELDIPLLVDPDLREQGGEQIPWIESMEEFQAAVAEHFSRPTHVVLGAESSSAAVDRFEMAVSRARIDRRCPVLVSHGRIMCGYMARAVGIDPMSIWPTLLMPDAIMLDLDTGQWCAVDREEPR